MQYMATEISNGKQTVKLYHSVNRGDPGAFVDAKLIAATCDLLRHGNQDFYGKNETPPISARQKQ